MTMNAKSLCIVLLAASFLPSAVLAADKDKEKDLPPGLRKKDKLPPGWEKKVGKDGQVTETPAAPTTAAPATPAKPGDPVATKPTPTPAPTAAPAPRPIKEVKNSVDKRIQTINTLDNKAAAREAAFAAIAKETGVTANKVQAQHREHPTIGTSGLLLANLISAQTKKPAANYLRQRSSGKPWAEIAEDNKFDLEKADAALGRLETSMRTAK